MTRAVAIAVALVLALVGCATTTTRTLARIAEDPVPNQPDAIVLRTVIDASTILVTSMYPHDCHRDLYDVIEDDVMEPGQLAPQRTRRKLKAGTLLVACNLPVPHQPIEIVLATGDVVDGITDDHGTFEHQATSVQLAGPVVARSSSTARPVPPPPPPPPTPAPHPTTNDTDLEASTPPSPTPPTPPPPLAGLGATATGPAATFDPQKSRAAFAAVRTIVNQCAATHHWGGVVKLHIEVDRAGIANAESNFGNDAFKKCVREGVALTEFPASAAGQKLDVKYAIVLPH